MNRLAMCGLVLVLATAGCGGTYYKMESHVVEAARPGAREFTATPEYSVLIKKVKRVAVRAPDGGCANQTAQSQTGEGTGQGVVVRTECGVEMAEIERELSRAGFVVSSWKALKNVVESGRSDVNTPLAAAKSLGAEVLFQINSLERGGVTRLDARLERKVFESDKYGRTKKPVAVPEFAFDFLKRAAAEPELKLRLEERQVATVNINAVLVETGQTIWFFRASKVEERPMSSASTVLAKREGDMVFEVRPEATMDSELVKSGEIEAVSSQSNGSHKSAVQFQLLRDVIHDFTAQFVSGEGGGSGAPPTASRAPD